MNPDLHNEADRVWNATLPALRRRRTRRRSLLAGSAVLTMGALALFWSLQPEHPAHAPDLAVTAASQELPEPTSLAVLVVDHLGTRFEQLRPDQCAGEGLEFDLTLEPVITSSVMEW